VIGLSLGHKTTATAHEKKFLRQQNIFCPNPSSRKSIIIYNYFYKLLIGNLAFFLNQSHGILRKKFGALTLKEMTMAQRSRLWAEFDYSGSTKEPKGVRKYLIEAFGKNPIGCSWKTKTKVHPSSASSDLKEAIAAWVCTEKERSDWLIKVTWQFLTILTKLFTEIFWAGLVWIWILSINNIGPSAFHLKAFQ